MKSVCVIGDIHGCYKTFRALLKKLPDVPIVIAGDLIDRGPDSSQVIQYCIDNNIQVTTGNHEDMLLSYLDSPIIYHPFLMNGGQITLNCYDGGHINDEHHEWLVNLPVYLEFPELIDANGRYLVVSHSHICNVWEELRKNGMNEKLKSRILWDRPFTLKQIPEIYNIIGHTPVDLPKIKQTYANIDTGCVFNGDLTALQFPEMNVFQQENIEVIK